MAPEGLSGWARLVEEILDGRVHRQPYVRIGPTPLVLRRYGLGPHDLVMTPGKIVRAAREHPEITRAIWRNLPKSLGAPVAILPSSHRNGSIVPVLAIAGELADPVLVPIIPSSDGRGNIVLSVYSKPDGMAWIAREARYAEAEGLRYFVDEGFAATMQKPESASVDAISSSPGPIPADGTAKPARPILGLRGKSTKS